MQIVEDLEDPPVEGESVLLGTLAGFARTLAEGYEITDALHDLTDRVSGILGITGAGVSLLHDGHMSFVTAGSERTASLERVQEDQHQGPCVLAQRTGEVVAISDLADEAVGQWPSYAAQGAKVGIHAVASVPMRVDGSSIGVVDLYDSSPRAWSAEELAVARVLANMATSYVINASKLEKQRRTTEQLQRALDSRVIIEQAKGVISAQRGVSIDEAFKLLRKHANDHQANLHATAEAVVNLGLRI